MTREAIAVAATLVALGSVGDAMAQTPPSPTEIVDLRPYDTDRSGRVDTPEEARVLGLHRINATLARYDSDYDGRLNETEMATLSVGLSRLAGNEAGVHMTPAELAIMGQTRAEAAEGLPVETPSPRITPARERCATGSAWFVRRDRMELSPYTQAITQKEAKGASIALTNDDIADAESVEVHGVVSRAFTRTCDAPPDAEPGTMYLSGYTMAAYLQADGLRTDIDPTKDKSVLRLGADFQWGLFGGPLFNSQYVTLSPYVQSDFRGDAEIFGAQASWEPYNLQSRLGGSIHPTRAGLDYFWQFRAEADWMHVEDAGFTGLTPNTDYAWLGGVANAAIFPAADSLDYRLKLYGSWRYHRDMNNGIDARLYTLGVGWNLTESGDVAISLERIWGLEREKLTEAERTILSLNFKL